MASPGIRFLRCLDVFRWFSGWVGFPSGLVVGLVVFSGWVSIPKFVQLLAQDQFGNHGCGVHFTHKSSTFGRGSGEKTDSLRRGPFGGCRALLGSGSSRQLRWWYGEPGVRASSEKNNRRVMLTIDPFCIKRFADSLGFSEFQNAFAVLTCCMNVNGVRDAKIGLLF